MIVAIPTMPTFAPSLVHTPCGPSPSLSDVNRRKHQSQQPRQLLSCTKCRERKVKCDRTKPCSACCARGAPKECHFIAESGDYAPIQQSYELRKLRAENLRLKERLRASRISIEDEASDQSSESQIGERPGSSSQRKRTTRQRRFQGSEWSDSIYFGSPGLASVISDFAAVNLTPTSASSITHLLPRGSDMYTPKTPPPYPFATMFIATPVECIPQLLSVLPPRKEMMDYLTAFEKRVHICSFPHVPIEISKSEIERFFADEERHARMCPDMLALLFAAMALGAQHSMWDKSGGQWDEKVVDQMTQRGNVYIAAAMQALRLASFMHKPSLLGIQALVIMGPYLANSGRFLDSWTLFGTTIRSAQAIGLHRHPKSLDPAPPTQRECSIRQSLWWWMLHMDEQYSMTLGRPLGISAIGDCPAPYELTTDPQMLRFCEFVTHFTILARQILSSDRLTNMKIDELTDSLRGLLDTMPELLQFDETWLDKEKEVPEWPLSAMAAVYFCKTHTYLILLNRQRDDKHSGRCSTPSAKVSPSSFRAINRTPSSHQSPATPTKLTLRGRSLVLASSEDVLTAFLFFYIREPAALISWVIAQQAFNCSMILLLDALETGDISRIRRVEQAYAIFKELQDNNVHKIASLAVEKISWGLEELRKSMERSGPRHRYSTTEMHEAGQNEARRGPERMRDTVMGNTGMFSLEEPGLQSFTPETFAPFTWSSAGAGLPTSPLVQLKEEQESPPRHESKPFSRGKPRETKNTASIAGVLQSNRRSPHGSTPGQFGAAVSQEHTQIQSGGTVSAPPKCSAVQQHHGRYQNLASEYRLQQSNYPPRSSHHISSTSELLDSKWEPGAHENTAAAQGQRQTPPMTARNRPPMLSPQLRHNSCPSLHQSPTAAPAPRPTFPSPTVQKADDITGGKHTGIHIPWGDSAGPTPYSTGHGMTFLPMATQGQVLPRYQHGAAQHQHMGAYQYPFLGQTSGSTNASLAASDVQQVTAEEWRGWIDSSGAI